MTLISVQPLDRGQPFVAWRDGSPLLRGSDLERAEQLVGQRLGLTPEGPFFVAGWETIEQAAVILRSLFPRAGVVGDPPLDALLARPEGSV